MRISANAARAVLGLFCLLCAGVVAAQQPEPFRIVRHELVVDVPRGEAVFDLWFSEAPDLTTFDEFGRQATAFAYSIELPDLRNFLRRQRGDAENVHPFIKLFSGVVGTGARAVAHVVTPGAVGWGPIVATADIHQRGTRVSFRLPLSIFDTGDVKPYRANDYFAVHYFLEAFRFGYTTYSLARGGATVGTVDAPLEVRERELRTGNGSKRRFVIAHVLGFAATENDPDFFVSEFVDVGSVRFGPNRARPVGQRAQGRQRRRFRRSRPDVQCGRRGIELHRHGCPHHGRNPLAGKFRSRRHGVRRPSGALAATVPLAALGREAVRTHKPLSRRRRSRIFSTRST